jgi:hypothetical protein
VWPIREAFGWRAVILALTSGSPVTASGIVVSPRIIVLRYSEPVIAAEQWNMPVLIGAA